MPDANVSVTCTFKTASVTGHTVTVTVSGGHGTASASPASATEGTLITLSTTPDSGYTLDTWTVFAASSLDPLILNSNNTFLMPNENVTAICTFKTGGGGGGGGGGGSASDQERQADVEARRIPVPSIVPYFDAKGTDLNVEYHSRSDYVNAIRKHGAIYKVVQFSETSDAAKIREYGMEWIRRNYYDGVVSFTVKAVDLHMLNYRNSLGQLYDKILCGDRIEVRFINGDPIEKMGSHNYINLNPNDLNTPINLTSPTTGAENDYRYAIVGCEAGDIFVISADGGSAPRAYAFLNNEDKIISGARAAANASLRNEFIMAPQNAVTLVINDKGGWDSYIGNTDKIVRRTMTCLSAQYDLLKPENSSFKIGIPDISANIKYRESANKPISAPTKKDPPKIDQGDLIGQLVDMGLIEGGEDPDNPPQT